VTQLKKVTLHEIAYEKIKEKIMRGDFSEVNYTSQNLLVEELKMSRTPIVAALQRLQQEGFLKVISNQGILIQEPSINEINDFFDMRLAIETYSMKNLGEPLTDEDFHRLDEIIQEQIKCSESKDYLRFAQYDADFHQYLLQAGGNSLFVQTMSNIRQRLFFKTTYNLKKRQRMTTSIAEHESILDALKKGSIELGVKLLEEHLENGKIIK
jgi:DNA-binding GntR family transcriptional regulator